MAIKTYNGPGARNQYYGASLAGPVFKAIADRIYSLDAEWHADISNEDLSHVAQVKGGDIDEIRTASSRLSIRTLNETRGETWGTTKLDSARVEILPLEPEEGIMPSVRGMALKDALYLLESKGLKVHVQGKGRVVSQSIRAGARIREGNYVSITLRP